MAATTQAPGAGPTLTRQQRRMVAAGAIGTLMEYYDYYLYGLASAAVFPAVFFPGDDVALATLSSFATFAVGFLLRPVGGLLFGHIGDRYGRKRALLITVVGMGISTMIIGLIPPTAAIGAAAPIVLLVCRMGQGLFVGGEMGGAAAMVVEHAPPGRKGMFGAILISGAGIANIVSAGLMTLLGLGSHSFFMTWGWRIPFLLALVLAIVAVLLRRKLEESDEFQLHTATQAIDPKPASPLREVFRHPRNVVLGILIGLPQSIASYVVLTFGLAHLVSEGASAQTGFIGIVIVGVLQFFTAPMWGRLSDRFGRRAVYIGGCIGFAVLVGPAFALFGTQIGLLIWLGMVIGFVVPGVAMQATLQTMLAEMFPVGARTTGINIGYQVSNSIGGGFAPLISAALATAFGSVVPVVVYAAVVAAIGVVASAYASFERTPVRSAVPVR